MDQPKATGRLWLVSVRLCLAKNNATLRDATYVLEGRVRGEELAFRAGGREYRGRANGKTLELR
jgi:hypothetical protein